MLSDNDLVAMLAESMVEKLVAKTEMKKVSESVAVKVEMTAEQWVELSVESKADKREASSVWKKAVKSDNELAVLMVEQRAVW